MVRAAAALAKPGAEYFREGILKMRQKVGLDREPLFGLFYHPRNPRCEFGFPSTALLKRRTARRMRVLKSAQYYEYIYENNLTYCRM